MAINLVSLAMQFLTPDVIGRISAILGLDGAKTQNAIGAAVPGLLAGLLGTSKEPGGPERLADAANQHASMLDSFTGMLGGSSSGQTSLIDSGTQLVSSLLGGTKQNAIASALGQFSGVSQGSANSLLGMLAPMVLGMIGKQAGPGGMDASGIVSLLTSQKDNIAKALPSGFGDMLKGTGLFDSLGGVTGAASAAADQTRRAAASATASASRYATAATRDTSGGMRWLYWLIPLLVILGLLWYFLGNNRPAEVVPATTPATTTTTTTTTAPAAQNVVIGGVDAGQLATNALGTLRTSLEGITDTASAQAALPQLQQASTQIDNVASAFNQASAAQKATLAGMIGPALAPINQLFDKVMAIPGVADVLRPTIDAMKTKLATFTAT